MAMQRKTDTTGAGARKQQSTSQDYRSAYEKYSQSQSTAQTRPGAKKPAPRNYSDSKTAPQTQTIRQKRRGY